MKDLTFLRQFNLTHNGEVVERYDVYIDYVQLRKQAIKAKESKNLTSRDGALVVKVVR